MTKKDYIEVARIIKGVEPLGSMNDGAKAGIELARREIARELASLFQRDNGRFDRERFMAACGL